MNVEKRKFLLPVIAIVAVVALIIALQQHPAEYHNDKGMIFGTYFNVTYQYEEDVEADILAVLQEVDNSLSMFNEQSVISRVNQDKEVALDKHFLNVFSIAQYVNKETDGAFDITVAPLVNAWGFGFKNGTAPSSSQVDSLRSLIGMDKLSLTSTNDGHNVIKKSVEGMMLDCSAVAKGYGVDVVAKLLRDKGIKNFMVEIGGEVVTSGVSSKRLPWRIGVVKPTDDTLNVDNELQTCLNVTDKAMATSGNYRNFYYKGGKKYAHTIDPKTGYPVQHNILSATVLADDCATADAFATAFMVMGLERTKQVLSRHSELMAYLIYSDDNGEMQVWYSPTMRDKIIEE